MKLLYTNENRLIVGNARNLLEAAGIETVLKNEFAGGGVGELSVFDTWLEIWLVDDGNYERAKTLLDNSLSEAGAAPWHCASCGETNDPSFELCWNCRREAPATQI